MRRRRRRHRSRGRRRGNHGQGSTGRTDHRARHRLVEGLGDDRAEGRRRRADRARHRPAREPRRQARLCRRHGARPRSRCARRSSRPSGSPGTNIENVWVSFSAGGLVSDVAEVEVELGGHRIEQEDIDALLAAGRDAIEPEGGWCSTRSRALHARRPDGRQEAARAACRPAGRRHPRRRRRRLAGAQPRPVRPFGASRGQVDRRLAGRDRALPA